MNTYVIRIYRPQPYLLVGVLEEVGVEGKKDSNIRLFSMGILRGHRKVQIGWLAKAFLYSFGSFSSVCKGDLSKIN